MASCRCGEISNISEDIAKLSTIKSIFQRNLGLINDVICYDDRLAAKEIDIYESDISNSVSEKIRLQDDMLLDEAEGIIQDINNTIDNLNNNRKALSIEDNEYHEEQKKLEEESKTERLQLI
ncbi:MAG: hypothetical protein MJ112_01690 [Lachnospiraceae bacterium]|nr:hypothetical protein [Lachnospiraceae bacterium]